ncbi:MAG: outer membrane protein [Candidatus Sumerlaeota bacterium]|nr:outer membrane protein [Candidatus Sumerlaeota bacterium]
MLEVPGLAGEPVPLTMREVVMTTLAQNFNIQIQLKNRDIAAESVWSEYGIYDPLVSGQVSQSRVDRPSVGIDGNGNSVRTALQSDTLGSSVSIAQLTPLGSTVTVTAGESAMYDHHAGNVGASSTTSSLYNRSYSTSASIGVRQPLLKNFGPLVTNANIRISKRQLEQSNEQFRGEVMDRLAAVMAAYWDLDFALRNLDVQRKAMESALELERVNSKRVEVGNLPRLSLLQAQAQVASREAFLVTAESQVIEAQDRLLTLMSWDINNARWNEPIFPADPLSYYEDIVIDDAKAIEVALASRPDLVQARLDFEIAEINRNVSRRQRLPNLDAFANYTLSGLDDDRGPAYGDLGQGDYGGYSYGLELRYPLFNRRARAAYHQALDRVDQADLQVDNSELQAMREVRAATRAIRTALQRIAATTRQVAADEEKLDAERKRLDVGERTVFDVLDFQDDLAESRANQSRALADYQIALIELARSTGVLLEVQGITVAPQDEPRGWAYSFEPEKESPITTVDSREWVSFLRDLEGKKTAP